MHNSVLGIRQYASSHYATFRSIEEEDVDAFIENEKTGLSGSNYLNDDETVYSLFTMPAEENFAGKNILWFFAAYSDEHMRMRMPNAPLLIYSTNRMWWWYTGVKYSLDWLNEFASGKCNKRNSKWKTLLDAAGFVGTNPLDLKKYPADFVTVSFYKVFFFSSFLSFVYR